jgi:hypothetical protein
MEHSCLRFDVLLETKLVLGQHIKLSYGNGVNFIELGADQKKRAGHQLPSVLTEGEPSLKEAVQKS